jgi:AcrR family transcriptional regulator
MCQAFGMSDPATTEAPPAWESRALERSLAAARGRSSARARRLVEGARQLATAGSSTFTIADIAAEAGVSLRTFYRHFADRDDLLLALIEEDARTGAAVLRELMGDGGAPLERVQRCVETICELVVAGSGYAALLVREHLRLADEHPQELRAALAPLLDVIEAELARAAASGRLREADRFDAATVLSLVLTHAHNAAFLTSAQPSPASASQRIWDFCLAALAPAKEGSQ